MVRVEDDIFICHDGSHLPVAYTASPFATDDGIVGCVVLFEDITERKAAALLVKRDLDKLTDVPIDSIIAVKEGAGIVPHPFPKYALRAGSAPSIAAMATSRPVFN